MALLYKYLSPEPTKDGITLPLLVLKTMRLSATNPCAFNDPFEVRPWFNQIRHNHAARTQESFHKQVMGIDHSLVMGRSMAEIPTENASGFGEHLNKRFRDEIGRRFRVLCLSENPKSVLMWGHYTQAHAGIVLGIDTDVSGFNQGMKSNGFEVLYSEDRSKTKLPLAFYQSPSVEMFDLRGNLVNHPDQEVESDGGLVIPFSEYRRQVEQAEINALSIKAKDWHYEQEVRYIYKLPEHSSQLVFENKRHFVSIPPQALREIIFGFRADPNLVRSVVGLFREGKIGNPRLMYAECHPNLYEVKPQETGAQYLLDYFQTVLPSM